MTPAGKSLCLVYGAIALVALVATWGNNIAYFQTGAGLVDFFKQGYLNYATSSLTNDLAIAVSVMFPLFPIARERARAVAARPADSVSP